jgi:hypothetical protein
VTDGLFSHQHDAAHLPKVFYTNTGYESWGRAASLIHTSFDGSRDVALQPNERVYHLASGQHFLGRFPPPDASRLPGSNVYRGNPLHFQYALRALLVGMVDWVWSRGEPPPNTHPRIDEATLVPLEDVQFPRIPGLTFPTVTHDAYRVDYGPRWRDGIIDNQPPLVGEPFGVRVPQTDEFGNDRGGVPTVEILAPLATYAPWNLRTGFAGGTEELTDFIGTYIPLPRTEAERRKMGDPRPSIESLYDGREDYWDVARRAALQLVEQGFLLEEHVDAVMRRAGEHWDWIHRN